MPAFDRVVAEVLSVWPQHERYLTGNIRQRTDEILRFSEHIAGKIVTVAEHAEGGLTRLACDYRYLCEKIVLPEELHFRRHGQYRLTTFEEAFRMVYADRRFMTRYMDGLLVSDVVWLNHCRCMMHYREEFLPGLPAGADLLEIGPGHGLLLSLADEVDGLGTITAWDISDASLALAAENVATLGVRRDVTFEKRNIFDPDIMDPANGEQFDAVVLSEVLEHLEVPAQALAVLHHLCRPGGKVWINVPANSPAPDHLYLVSDIVEPVALLCAAGFEVEAHHAFPMSGTTMEKALEARLTFNCVLVGRKPGAGR